MGITKERVSHQNGQTHYRVLIRFFRDKMRNWNQGRLVRLKTIDVDGVPLKLEVYPNGDSRENSGYVSLYIANLGTYDVGVEVDLHLHREHMNDVLDLKAGHYCGYLRFLDTDLLDIRADDEDLQITCTFKRVWKEVEGYNNNEAQTTKLEDEIKQLSEKCDNSTAMIKSLQESMRKIENELINKKEIPLPECPVCFTDLGPGIKIAQCPSGHLLCWNCKERMSAPQCIAPCPSCKAPVINRAHGMENYINHIAFSNML